VLPLLLLALRADLCMMLLWELSLYCKAALQCSTLYWQYTSFCVKEGSAYTPDV
jgi:hypothetical protein